MHNAAPHIWLRPDKASLTPSASPLSAIAVREKRSRTCDEPMPSAARPITPASSTSVIHFAPSSRQPENSTINA
ncbi:hypothetical protein D3C81_864140 [compost metagenome]